jgi:hypothetical protein
MVVIAVPLTEDQAARLRDMARRLHTTVEALAHAGIQDLLMRADDEFEEAARYVLEKNAELYRRLAAS